MTTALRNVLLWALLLLVSGIASAALEHPQSLILKLSPMSLFELDRDIWLGLAITFGASIIAWATGVVVAYLLGWLIAATIVDRRSSDGWSNFGRLVDKLYDWLYIIPFVLTVSLTSAFVMPLVTNHQAPRYVVFIALISVAGIALGGYHVYKCFFRSVQDAKREDRQLVDSLYFKSAGRLSRVKKLRDCRIDSFCDAVTTAFHLAIVAVMIVEMITPQLYEYLWGSSGTLGAWAGGAGRRILSAQSTYRYEVIAGCIWAVILFDSVFTEIIRLGMHHRWLKFYKGEQ